MSAADRPAAVVRRATVADADAMASAHVRSWQAAYRGIVPDEVLDGLSVERRAMFWSRQISEMEPPSTAWVVDEAGHVAGFVSIGRESEHDVDDADAPTDDEGPPPGELYAIYLEPEAWSHGLGRALMAAAVEGLHAGGFSTAILWVFAANDRARRFYERTGWRLDGGTRTWEASGATLPVVRYRLDL
jgi:GNAT superfamily N-acetyltransferase